VHCSRCPAEHVIDCDPPVSRYARGGPMQLIDENLIQGALPLGVLVMTEQSSPPAYRIRFPMHGTTLRKSPRDARRQRNRSCFGCSHDAYKAPLLPLVDDSQQLHPALVVPSQPAHRDDHDDAIVPSPSMVGTLLRRDATGFVLRAPTAWRMAGFPPEHLYRSAGCLRDGRVVQKLLYVLFAPTGAVFRSPPIEFLHHRPARWRGGSALLAARSRCASIPSSSSGSRSPIRSQLVCTPDATESTLGFPIGLPPFCAHSLSRPLPVV
jgi:hypothetical protein